ncbi:MAG: hypothetical protein AAFR59_20350, partial [Bacteroidota bacterium]
MRHIGFLWLCLILGGLLHAQDAYHQGLQSELQADFGLSGGTWVFSSTEAANLSDATRYGGSYSTQSTSGLPFGTKARMFINAARPQTYNAGWFLQNPNSIQRDDVILIVFYLRSVGTVGRVNFFAEDASTFDKEIFYNMPVDTGWQRYFIPIQISKNYSAQGLSVGFHLGHQAQTIEIGGFTALNFGNSYPLEAFPSEVNNRFYDGWEPDAPWRNEAATRIENLRKANL